MTTYDTLQIKRTGWTRKGRLSVNAGTVRDIIVFLVYLKPAGIEVFPYLDLPFNLARFGLAIYYAFVYLKKTRMRISAEVGLPLTIFLVVLGSTIWHRGSLYLVFRNYVPAIGFVLFLAINRSRWLHIVYIMFRVTSVLVVANGILAPLFPNGMFTFEGLPVWLLGQKQSLWPALSIAMLSGLICVYLRPSLKPRFVLTMVAMVVLLLTTKPVGAAAVLLCYAMMMALRRVALYFKLSGKKLLGIIFVVFLIVLYLTYAYSNMTFLQNELSAFSRRFNMFDKATSITQRVGMWQYAIRSFLSHPLFGIGSPTESTWWQQSGLDFYYPIVHNLYLEILMTGGLAAFGAYVLLPVHAVKCLKPTWRHYISYSLAAYIFILGILSMTESTYHPMLFGVYSIACYAGTDLAAEKRKRMIPADG